MLSMAYEIIKRGWGGIFNYEGFTSRKEYFLFSLFQLGWFYFYLSFIAVNDYISIIPFFLFLLPLIACAVRRINDAGYSRGVIVLLVIAPYIMFLFLLFPASRK